MVLFLFLATLVQESPTTAGATKVAESETITVTATATENDTYHAPKSVTVIGPQEILRKSARTVPEILREELGIRVQETNFGGGSPILRGLIGNQVLVLIDGVRLNNATTRLGPNQYLNTIDPKIIERIEVVRGPGSVLYGSDAAGGVIQIFTKKRRELHPGASFGGSHAARFESASKGRTGSLEMEGNVDGFGFYSVFSAGKFSDLRAGEGTGTQENTGYGPETHGMGNLRYRIDDSREWLFSAQVTDQREVPRSDRLNGGPGGSIKDIINEIDPQRRELYYWSYRDTGMRGISDDMELTLSLQRQTEVHEQQQVGSNKLTQEAFDDKTFGVSLRFHKTLGSLEGVSLHRLTWGAETYLDDVDSYRNEINQTTGAMAPKQAQFPQNSSYQSIGLYLQDEWQVSESFDVVGGVRWSNYSQDGTLPSPAGQVSSDFSAITWGLDFGYDLSDNVRFVLGGAQGFRAPSLEDTMVLNISTNQGVDVPNPDLKEETYRNLETGVRWRGSRWRGSLLGFYTWIDDLIQRVPGTFQGSSTYNGQSVFMRDNVGRAFVSGIELESSYEFDHGFSSFGNLAYTAGRVESQNTPFRRIPPFGGAVGVRFEEPKEGKWWTTLSSEFALAQEKLSPDDIADIRIGPNGTGAYAIYNLRAGWQVTPMSHVFAGIENIGDIDYRVHGSGLNGPGRNLILAYELRF